MTKHELHLFIKNIDNLKVCCAINNLILLYFIIPYYI